MKFNELNFSSGINDWRPICLEIDGEKYSITCRVDNELYQICIDLKHIDSGYTSKIKTDLYWDLHKIDELEQVIIEEMPHTIWNVGV